MDFFFSRWPPSLINGRHGNWWRVEEENAELYMVKINNFLETNVQALWLKKCLTQAISGVVQNGWLPFVINFFQQN